MPDYRDFFSLRQSPFEAQALRPLVLETGPLRRVSAWVRAELAARTPILAVFGSRGIGKTSTAMALPHLLEDRVACVLDPTRPWNEIRASIAEQFALDAETLSREALLAGRPTPTVRLVLVVDDAEELPTESLARLQRVLGYTDARGRPLVRCILLAKPDGRGSGAAAARWILAVKSRIQLAPMLARELHRYIEARLENAGWQGGELFAREAVEAIHRASGGVPLAANRICEALLVEAAQRRETSIGRDRAEELCAGLRAGPAAREEDATEPALKIDFPAPAPSGVESDASLPVIRAAPAATEVEEATEPAHPPRPMAVASDEEAVRPPAAPDRAPPPPESWSAPEVPGPRGPAARDPVPGANAGSRIGAALTARLAPLKSLAAHWGHRRWQEPAATIGLMTVLLAVGRIATVKTIEPERAADGASRVASEHAEPAAPASGWTVKPAHVRHLESEATWLESLRRELEIAAEATDPERTESSEPVEPEATETPDLEVAEPDETGRTETAEPGTPVRWLDDLELALDAKPGRPEAPRPKLALPEPELSRGLSPGGAAR